MVLSVVISYVDFLYFVTFVGWLELWLSWAVNCGCWGCTGGIARVEVGMGWYSPRALHAETAAAKVEQTEEFHGSPHGCPHGRTPKLKVMKAVTVPGLSATWVPRRTAKAELGTGWVVPLIMQRTPCKRANTEVGVSWGVPKLSMQRMPWQGSCSEVGAIQCGLHIENILAE